MYRNLSNNIPTFYTDALYLYRATFETGIPSRTYRQVLHMTHQLPDALETPPPDERALTSKEKKVNALRYGFYHRLPLSCSCFLFLFLILAVHPLFHFDKPCAAECTTKGTWTAHDDRLSSKRRPRISSGRYERQRRRCRKSRIVSRWPNGRRVRTCR